MTKRWRWLVGIAVTVVALGGATWALAVWIHLPVRLSASAAVCDVESRTALSENGEWLASAWIQGRQVNNGCVGRGTVVIRWATTELSQTGWSNQTALPLPGGYGTGCFVHTDVALNNNTAHVAATVWAPCNQMNADSVIAYYTCNLSTGVCSSATIVASQSGAENLRFSEAQIVLDSQNRPHIVYGRGDHSLAQGKLFYTRNLGTGWSTPLLISPGSETAYRPSLAASNGRIHIVWENHRDYLDSHGRWRQNGDVRYRYCEEAGTCGNITGYPSPTTLVETTYPIPDIAARDDRVILTWNVCADVDSNPPCEEFYLVYARSNTNGSSFAAQPLEVGTEMELRNITFSSQYYHGSDGDDNPAGEYAAHLNSTVELDPTGLPYLVWQIQQNGGYVITTTHAISATYENFTWAQSSLPQFGDGSDNRVYPSLELTTVDDIQALHIVYMQTWREGIWGRSQVFYDAASPAQPTLRLSYTERTSGLPGGRAQTITAYVEQQDGTGASGVPVVFITTLGSFAYSGYGVSQIQTMTDAQGAATVILYSNQVGTAQVHAWVDSVTDLHQDAEEPGSVLTQTWVFTGTPSLTASPGPVMGGDWITTTISDHPYTDLDDLEGGGLPLSYYLWWCPVSASEDPPAQQVGEDFNVGIDTWGRSSIIQVPFGVDGTYRLETHTDSEGNPCANADTRVASTAEISATSDYPPGALITISNQRPYPNDTMTATLRQHPDGTYDVWWCTDTGKSVTQVVIEDVVVSDSADVETELYVPTGVSGSYHLESHTNTLTATCGNMTTYVASSRLTIWPLSKIFLPLVIRGK